MVKAALMDHFGHLRAAEQAGSFYKGVATNMLANNYLSTHPAEKEHQYLFGVMFVFTYGM